MPATWSRALLACVVAPGPALGALAASPAPRLALAVAGGVGCAWALFSALLAWRGHAPSGPLVLPVERADYYSVQAGFAAPLFVALALVAAGAGHGAARALGGGGRFAATLTVTSVSLALPSLCAWLLPDVLVYLALGFDALARIVRFQVVVVLAWTMTLLFVAFRRAHGLGSGRALAAALAAYLGQALLAAPLLR